MTANDRVENTRAAYEAREAIARRATGRRRAAEDALNRYLASESFHEHRREQQELDDEAPGHVEGKH